MSQTTTHAQMSLHDHRAVSPVHVYGTERNRPNPRLVASIRLTSPCTNWRLASAGRLFQFQLRPRLLPLRAAIGRARQTPPASNAALPYPTPTAKWRWANTPAPTA